MKSHRYVLGALVTLAFAACDPPTAPLADVLDEAALAQFAEAVSEATDIRMPSLGALLRASREAIQATDGGHEEAIRHFRAAHRLALASEEAAEAGDKDTAGQLARRSYVQKLLGIVATLGTEAVADAVAGSAAGLERLQDHLAGRDVPDRLTERVARIEKTVTAAHEKLAAGEPVHALHQALAAAEGIRSLSPRYVARKRIQRATTLLRQAIAAVGDTPTDEEATALRRARRLLGVATEQLETGHPRLAFEAAQRSAHLSWGVVQGRASDSG